MNPVRRSKKLPLSRLFSLFWLALGLAGAAIEGVRAFNGLKSGLMRFPFDLGLWSPVARTSEPLMFHGALALSLIATVVFLYIAYGACRYGTWSRSAANPAAPAR